MSYRTYRGIWYRYCCRTQRRAPVLRFCRSVRYRIHVVPNLAKCPLPVLPSSGIDVVPNLPKCPVPVFMLYRSYGSVRYRYDCHTELNFHKCMSCRNYTLVRYRYWCCTELTKVSGTGIIVTPNLPKVPGTALDAGPKSPKCPDRY